MDTATKRVKWHTIEGYTLGRQLEHMGSKYYMFCPKGRFQLSVVSAQFADSKQFLQNA